MKRFAGLALALGGALLAGHALAAVQAPAPTQPSAEVSFLIEIVVLVIAGRIGGELLQRVGQPAVMGQLLAGVVLGPSVFGAIAPALQSTVFPSNPTVHAMVDAVAQLGILMLLLLTGMETDLRLVRRVGAPAILVSVAGIAVPFVFGYLLGQFAPDWIIPDPSRRLVTALFLGTALSIASVKIVAMVVRELGFLRRNVGQIIIASAILDDTIGWIIIGVISGIAEHGEVEVSSVLFTFVGVTLFLGLSLTVGRRAVSLLIRWTNDNFRSEMPVISVILAITFVMALITQGIGVHTVLGAFVAGVLIGESPILTRHIDEELRGLITALFMPVFFCLSGLSADLTVLVNPTLLALTIGFILIASVGKFGGAFVGGLLGRLSLRECLALAAGMNARGSTEVIVATIGLSIGALDRNLYTMIVTMAVVTTLAMPPMLRWALARVPFKADEKERLEREEVEEKGFVSNLERLLLAIDDGANGKLASRVAGLIAGARGLPTTVLQWEQSGPRLEQAEEEAAPEGDVVADAAKTSRATEAESGERPAKADILTRPAHVSMAEAVKAEAAKGYDLLIVGVEGLSTEQSAVAEDVSRAAAAFEGPLAVAHARSEPIEDKPLRILVPVTGTPVSRRAAEVAFALARATSGRVTALYVSPIGRKGGRITQSLDGLIRSEEAILRDIAVLGEQTGVTVRTAMRAGEPAQDAILRYAHNGRHDLLVMGVSRRPGESLSFGIVADAVLEASKRSLVFVAS